MLLVRKQMGAHKDYAQFRSALELLEATGHSDIVANIEAGDTAATAETKADGMAAGGSATVASRGSDGAASVEATVAQLQRELSATKAQLANQAQEIQAVLNGRSVATTTAQNAAAVRNAAAAEAREGKGGDHGLSEKRRKRAVAAFHQYDRDGSGRIDPMELRERIARDLGLEDVLSEAAVATLAADIIAKADRDGDSQLNLDEFLFFYSKCLASTKKRQAYAERVSRRLEHANTAEGSGREGLTAQVSKLQQELATTRAELATTRAELAEERRLSAETRSMVEALAAQMAALINSGQRPLTPRSRKKLPPVRRPPSDASR